MPNIRESVQDAGVDPEMMAYIDGQLGPEAAAEFELRLASDTDARLTAAALAQDCRLIRDAAASMDTSPTSLRTAALERTLAKRLGVASQVLDAAHSDAGRFQRNQQL